MTIGAAQQFFLGASKATGGGAAGYQIERSLRFNSSDSAFCSRTPAVAGNRTTWTWAGWLKRSGTSRDVLFAQWSGLGFAFEIDSSSRIDAYDYTSSYDWHLISTPVYRDPSAWYHIVLAYDTTQATASNRIKLYVNGTQVTTFSTETYPSPSYAGYVNTASAHEIGGAFGVYLDGYLADIHFIDGQALTPSSFTEVSATTGQLEPKAYTGSFGTNGFWLKFSDNSAATAATLGKDYSGNSNNWTPNNFSVAATAYTTANSITSSGGLSNASRILDGTASADATIASGAAYIEFNPPGGISYTTSVEVMGAGSPNSPYNTRWQLNNGSLVNAVNANSWVTLASGSGTITEIRLQCDTGGLNWRGIRVDGVILKEDAGPGIDSLVDSPTSYGTDTGVGGEVRGNYCTLNPLEQKGTTLTNGNLEVSGATGGDDLAYGTIGTSTGKWYFEATLSSFTNLTFIGIDTGNKLQLGGGPGDVDVIVWLNDGRKLVNGTYTATGQTYTTNDVVGVSYDFTNNQVIFYKNGTLALTISATLTGKTYKPIFWVYNTPAKFIANFGQRPFAYQTPGTNRPAATFLALCDTNLPAPVVAKPNTVMDVKLYTGNGSTQTISGLGFSPDFVWLKARSAAEQHVVFDQVRGAGYRLLTAGTNSEALETNTLSAFTSDGFSVGLSQGVNGSSTTMVAWAWDAGSSTVSNTQGSITSQVRANASAGFSVVTYTGPGSSNSTVGHGLGVAPELIITKNRDRSIYWIVYTKATGKDAFLRLNTTDASTASSNIWGTAAPTSAVFGGVGTDLSNGFTAGEKIVSYCFAPVVGYSSFGSYTGNGLADGPFVYTGFRPRWIMVKRSDSTEQWYINDAARDDYNVTGKSLRAQSSGAEASTGGSNSSTWDILSNGFKLRDAGAGTNASGGTYIFAAFAENPFQYARAR